MPEPCIAIVPQRQSQNHGPAARHTVERPVALKVMRNARLMSAMRQRLRPAVRGGAVRYRPTYPPIQSVCRQARSRTPLLQSISPMISLTNLSIAVTNDIRVSALATVPEGSNACVVFAHGAAEHGWRKALAPDAGLAQGLKDRSPIQRLRGLSESSAERLLERSGARRYGSHGRQHPCEGCCVGPRRAAG